MNRHHYGLYIHGEKLVLLLRREAEDVKSREDMQVFRPAEFRWKLPQISDDHWHHYTVNVDFDEFRSDGGVCCPCELISLMLKIECKIEI